MKTEKPIHRKRKILGLNLFYTLFFLGVLILTMLASFFTYMDKLNSEKLEVKFKLEESKKAYDEAKDLTSMLTAEYEVQAEIISQRDHELIKGGYQKGYLIEITPEEGLATYIEIFIKENGESVVNKVDVDYTEGFEQQIYNE